MTKILVMEEVACHSDMVYTSKSHRPARAHANVVAFSINASHFTSDYILLRLCTCFQNKVKSELR